MNAQFDHIYIYCLDKDKTYGFYKPLMEYLGYKEFIKEDWGFGFSKDGYSLIFEQTPIDKLPEGFDRRRSGLNHIAFRVDSKDEVDKFTQECLVPLSARLLYSTPKLFPQYGPDYYAVFFEDPDKLKLEVAFHS